LAAKKITATYQILVTDHLLAADSTAGAFTGTLPALADAYQLLTATEGVGQEIIVVLRVDGGDFTLEGSGAETINGAANITLDDAGDVIVVRATATEWTIIKAAGSLSADLADGAVTAAKMATGGDKFDQGRVCVGYFYLTASAADTETVTINSRVYEFDTDSTTTGDVDVDINADQTADAACTALVTAVNADAARVVDAVAMAGNHDGNAGVMLVAKAVGATNYTLATTAGNGVVSAAALTGAKAVADTLLYPFTYTVTAADVTLLADANADSVAVAGFASTTEPTLNSLVITTSGGWTVPVVTTVFTWLQANSNFWILVVDDSAATLTAGDVIAGIATV
jgi:hypothetical protein